MSVKQSINREIGLEHYNHGSELIREDELVKTFFCKTCQKFFSMFVRSAKSK